MSLKEIKNMLKIKKRILLIILLLLTSCGGKIEKYYNGNAFYYYPDELKNEDVKNNILVANLKILKDKKIFLDAGHGGEDRKNFSINKKVIEADINLYVCQYLKEFLEQSGAKVYMMRNSDSTVALKERNKRVALSDADIFISIHHNAPGKKEDFLTNYTSTYFHSREGEYNFNPSSQILARFVQRDLAYVMRNSGGLGSFDGTYSDYIIYPGQGFAVLRNQNIPSVLVECSFFTNLIEEERLQDSIFNKLEAWGIYKGIVRYFSVEIPKIAFMGIFKEDSLEYYNFKVINKNKVNQKSIEVFKNRVIEELLFLQNTNEIKIKKNNIYTSDTIKINCSNINNRYNHPYIYIYDKNKYKLNYEVLNGK